MKFQNAIKKVAKATGTEPIKNGMFYVSQIGNYNLRFCKSSISDDVSTISVCRKGEKSDIMSDYFPQMYFDNITQALNWTISQTF